MQQSENASLVAVSAFVSAVVSIVVVLALPPAEAAPEGAVDAPATPHPLELVQKSDIAYLQTQLDELSMELALIRDGDDRRTDAVEVRIVERLAALESRLAGDATIETRIEEAVTKLEEEKEAERREKEMQERRDQAVQSNMQHDWLDEVLEDKLVEMQGELELDGAQVDELRDMLTTQNERNREMTRLWSAGDTSDEELVRLYTERQTLHRAEMTELFGPEKVRLYKKYLREGGLGDLFNYFVAPWEDWTQRDE